MVTYEGQARRRGVVESETGPKTENNTEEGLLRCVLKRHRVP